MFREILRFELRQQLERPAFWLIVLAFVAIGMLEMTGPGVTLLGVRAGIARITGRPLCAAMRITCSRYGISR